MSFGAHTIQPAADSKRTSKRVGRGNGSGKGNYSARGMKGQRARSGGKSSTAVIGFKQSIRKIPKLRGFTSQQKRVGTVTLQMLHRNFEDGASVTLEQLIAAGMVKSSVSGIKIVATGELKKKLVISGCIASGAALKAIEAAGGSLITE
jgi:large subunit ribosomal protein L15